MKKWYLLSFLLTAFSVCLVAQSTNNEPVLLSPNHNLVSSDFAFNNQNQLLSGPNFNSILIIGIADMNGDKLDDIIRLEEGRTLTIEYQTPGGHFSSYFYGNVSAVQQICLAIADVDANGFNDIMVGGLEDEIKILMADDQGESYTEQVLPESSFWVQGSNFVDINEDGAVDVFACNDLAENRIWENTGNGNFVTADDWIDMTTDPPSDNSGNYASTWTDFDNDGDLDLYISKCKVGVTDFEAVERLNQLFVNDGEQNFTEMAGEYGLKNGAQTWTSDFQDIDNDGDLDCFLANHKDTISQLFLNDGTGHYTDITLSSGIYIDTDPLQAALRDFDNDGFVDIIVAGINGYQFYKNNGDQTFSEIPELFDTYQMGTFAIGDLNHDGFLDIYSGSPETSDVLWINEKNDNNYFAVNLNSDFGNANAIGARLELYGDWGIQIREVRAGESYGIANSFTQHFGLGLHEEIDSLVLRWPSGNVETFANPAINQFLNIKEGECAYPDCYIIKPDDLVLCSGDVLELTAPPGNIYNWSNDEMTQTIEITEGGTYQVTVTNAFGCSAVSEIVEIIQDPDTQPVITALGSTVFCVGQTVQLQSTPALDHLWSSGQETSTILVFASGIYTVTAIGYCEDLVSEPVEVTVIALPDAPMVTDAIINEVPATAVLTATGDNPHWYDAPVGGTLLGEGNDFETPELIGTTSFYVQDVVSVDDVSCNSPRVEAMVILDSLNSTHELVQGDLYSIFPNPANDFFIIQKEQSNAQATIIRFYDSLGRLIHAERMAEDEDRIIIDAKLMGTGMNTIVLESGDRLLYYKLLITKD